MTIRKKRPDGVRQHAIGAEKETQMHPNFQNQIYATCGDLQTRHVRNRCGLSHARAHLVAALCFGEDQR